MTDNKANQVIRGYQLHEQIGVGAFGSVYRASQPGINRNVAIKVISPEKASQPKFIRRFEQEAQLVASLEHPFITPLFDFWRDPGGAYLVMRYFRSGSFEGALESSTLSLAAASQLLDQIASALSVAHQHQIIHRDIKPSNILMDDEGNAFLADFGIANSLAEDQPGLTETGAILGTPDYLAPEQARSEPLSAQSDIYSLGILLYVVLTGSHPFPPASAVERILQHLSLQVPDLPERPDLSPAAASAVSAVIQKVTRKMAAERFADTLEMAEAFRQAVRGSSGVSDSIKVTAQELDLLHRLQTESSHQQIALDLGLEISQVQPLCQSLYAKLGLSSRAQALVRARQLDLLEGSRGSASLGFGNLDNPFKGLHAFQAGDAHKFFGREAMVQVLLDRLSDSEQGRFLAIVGASGSGKSSLVRAGLIPALWRGEIPGSDKWFTVDLTPVKSGMKSPLFRGLKRPLISGKNVRWTGGGGCFRIR